MRFLIVDDHPMLRASLRQLLRQSFPSCEFEEAGNAAQAIASVSKNTFDLILLDLDLPDRGGLDLFRDLNSLAPNSKVLVFSAAVESEYGPMVLRAGAAGFLRKACDESDILNAIQRVLSGRKYVSSDLASTLADSTIHERGSHLHLSAREFEVLRLLGTGCQPSEIADKLHISVKTVSTYRTRLLQKLGLHSTGDLVRYAVMHRLV